VRNQRAEVVHGTISEQDCNEACKDSAIKICEQRRNKSSIAGSGYAEDERHATNV
jgi:hypothetical protein